VAGRTATVPASPRVRSDERARPACTTKLSRPKTVLMIAKNDMSWDPRLNADAACDFST
jgi:hypothetical protein